MRAESIKFSQPPFGKTPEALKTIDRSFASRKLVLAVGKLCSEHNHSKLTHHKLSNHLYVSYFLLVFSL